MQWAKTIFAQDKEQTTSYKKYNESEEYPIPCMLRSCTLQSVFRKPSFHRSDRTEVRGVPKTAHTSLASGSVFWLRRDVLSRCLFCLISTRPYFSYTQIIKYKEMCMHASVVYNATDFTTTKYSIFPTFSIILM